MKIKHAEMVAAPGGNTKLTIIVDGDRGRIAKIIGNCDPDKYELEIKRIRNKRGLTANAYYWVLVEKISKELMTSKDEVHNIMMERYGTFRMFEGRPVLFSLQLGLDPKTVTPYSRAFAQGEVNGKTFIHYVVIKGSSELNSKEFNDLLQGAISEAKELGIETMTPDELAQMEYEYHYTA